MRKFGLLLIIYLLFLARMVAQSPNATINGLVLDPAGAAIAGADVLVVNDVTGVQYATKTNGEGIYVVSNLPPGSYRIQVSNSGFKTIIKPDIVIHVQDALAINFTLPVGAVSEIVTITVGAPLINTSDASVSTVVDQQFVQNMPLNGRSFHDLILLTPGVLTNTPQVSANNGNTGEFSVNGQRTESNYYTVDGVSANLGVPAGLVQNAGNSGSLPASTTLGTTQGLVSVDALEEFRVQTSTYSAEYGRNPGGQFSLVTRSGSNQWHGTAFDYLRNTVFDANDWFNNFFRRLKSPEHQNDFGGTLGGPVQIPGLYNGRDRTFFFFSYEGLRLLQPQAASVTDVPTVALRQSAPGPLQSLLNAFPLPSCPSSATNCATDLGNGFGQFVGTWSNPSSLDSYSLRLDEALTERLRLFFRFSATPSTVSTRSGSVDADPSAPVSVSARSETYTLGVTSQIAARSSNEFRVNHSSFEAGNLTQLDHFGGAVPFEALQVQGLDSSHPFYTVFTILYAANFSISAALTQYHSQGLQRQWNIVDTLATNVGRNLIKVGVDYRHLSPVQRFSDPSLFYEFAGPAAVQANTPAFASAQSRLPAYPRFMNFSAFAENEWRATGRWNLSVGLRWEVNPAPGAPTGNLPYTFQGDIGNPSALMLAPQGTPLWRTSWYNFAPRLGTAYVLHTDSRFQTVVRVGGGVFFDTGQQLGTSGYNGAGFSGTALYCSVPQFCAGPATFPLTPAQAFPPIPSPPVGPGLLLYGFAPHLQLPFTLQWNTSLSQAVGESQALTVSYVGAKGRRLLQSNELDSLKGPAIGTLIYGKNGLTSDYDALQVQFQRRMSHGLQGLASYTWGHSIDYGSRNVALPYQRGNSDFDVRHSFAGALSYDLPHSSRNSVARVFLKGWALDDRFTARTGFPVTLNGNQSVNPVTLQTYNAGLDLVPNQPLYISGSQCVSVYGSPCPGGWAINRSAFTNPPIDPNTGLPTRAGNAPRNFVQGFGAWQMDLAVRRNFPIHNRLKLQFRAEAFNLFNHPNFGTINSEYCSPGPFCTFGESTATLARSLGGLSPLYQIGGPRSMQFAIKLMF